MSSAGLCMALLHMLLEPRCAQALQSPLARVGFATGSCRLYQRPSCGSCDGLMGGPPMVFGNGDGGADNTSALEEDEEAPPASPTAAAKGEAGEDAVVEAIDGRCEIGGGGIGCGGDPWGGGGSCEAAPGGAVSGGGTPRHRRTLPFKWLNLMAPPGTSHCCQSLLAACTTGSPSGKYVS